MNRTITAATAAALFAAFASPAALAQDDNENGFYLGAGVGRFNVEIDNPDDVVDTVGSFDADDTTFKAFVGWRMNPYLAFEVDYIDLGNPEDVVDDQRIAADVNGIAPYLVGTVPIGPRSAQVSSACSRRPIISASKLA